MMSEKDPTFLQSTLELLKPQALPVTLTIMLSYLRIQFDDKEPRPIRQLIEVALGGGLALVIGLSCDYFAISAGWKYVAVGSIGTLGVNFVRSTARKWVARKVG